MATVQSGPGRIRLFNDFFCGWDQSDIAATTTLADLEMAGPFIIFGEGLLNLDAGLFHLNVLSGAVRVTSTAAAEDDPVCIGTYNAFKVGLMAPILLETRIQCNNLDTKRIFFGLTDAEGGDEKKDLSIEDDIVASTTLTFTPVASDYVGFLFSSEMSDVDVWHGLYRGGTEAMTGGAVSETYDFDGHELVAGDWQILRLEVDPNGTARWYIDGVLVKTQEGACATTVAMGVVLGVEGVGSAVEQMDVDYLLVEANRDWTV